jgi:hypothetical protein
MGPEVIDFTAPEADFMTKGGTKLVVIFATAVHEQPEALLPVG